MYACLILCSITAPPSFVCNFDVDRCAWTDDSTGDTLWSRLSGGTGSLNTGPTTDVSGSGFYMYVEASSPALPGYKARMFAERSVTGLLAK